MDSFIQPRECWINLNSCLGLELLGVVGSSVTVVVTCLCLCSRKRPEACPCLPQEPAPGAHPASRLQWLWERLLFHRAVRGCGGRTQGMQLGGMQARLRLAPLPVWLHVCHQEQTEPFWGFSSKEKCQNWHNVCSNKLCWQNSCRCHPNVNEPRWLREAISRRKRHRTYLHLALDYKYHCSLSSSQTETAGSVSAVHRGISPSCFRTRLIPRG